MTRDAVTSLRLSEAWSGALMFVFSLTYCHPSARILGQFEEQEPFIFTHLPHPVMFGDDAIKMLAPRRLSSLAASGKCQGEPIRLAKGAGTLIRGDSSKRGQQGELKRREQRGRSMKNSPSKGKR